MKGVGGRHASFVTLSFALRHLYYAQIDPAIRQSGKFDSKSDTP